MATMFALAAMTLAIPLHFEPNRGRATRHADFVAVTRRYTLELSDTTISINSSLRLNLPRTNPVGVDELSAKSNYYFGSDAAQWRTSIPNFARVRYKDVFRGIDLIVYGRDEKIEYDWIIAPGADPRAIRVSFTGASKILIDSGGDLVLKTKFGEVRHQHPHILQGVREIPGKFILNGNEIRFEVGDYDRTKSLVIDPVLVVNTSFGGTGITYDFPGVHGGAGDTGTGIATDASGNIYVTGTTFSTDFPLVNSLESAPSQSCPIDCEFSSIFVTKLTPDGKTILYSTYIGVPASATVGYTIPSLLPASIAVDSSGTVYLTGGTSGMNFPGVTTTAGGQDAFLLRLDPNGKLIGTLLFGGSGDDAGTSIVLGPDGFIYLAGTTQSPNFPVSANSYRSSSAGTTNLFLIKISFTSIFGSTNGAIIYSIIAGPGTSAAVAADSGGNAYLAASTTWAWPTTNGVVQPACAGSSCADIVVAKFDPLGQKLLYATYLGGSQTETLGGIAVDTAGEVYICGSTNSADFPVTAGVLEPQSKVDFSATTYTGFVTKISTDASHLIYSTYLGGSTSDQAMAIAVDSSGNAYVGGTTKSADFPIHYPFQATLFNTTCASYTPSGTTPSSELPCAFAGFLTVLNPTASAPVWSTYLGSGSVNAVMLDSDGNVYATGVEVAVSASATPSKVGVLKIAPGISPLDVPGNAVFNSASYAAGLPLPGGLASVTVSGLNITGTMAASGSGPLPTQMAGVTILVAGVPAPILAIAPVSSGMQQINFQVPFDATSNATEVQYQGSSVFLFPQTSAPGIFTLPDGTAAIQHAADYSLVTPSNPAHPGEVIVVYATGLGTVSPPVATGVAPTGPAQVSSTCGGIFLAGSSAPYSTGATLYAGVTPGIVGLYQLNIQLSPDLQPGTLQVWVNENACGFFPGAFPQGNIVNLPVE